MNHVCPTIQENVAVAQRRILEARYVWDICLKLLIGVEPCKAEILCKDVLIDVNVVFRSKKFSESLVKEGAIKYLEGYFVLPHPKCIHIYLRNKKLKQKLPGLEGSNQFRGPPEFRGFKS